MIRKIIHIDAEKCNGCGACVTACHEGAIDLVNGKAKLVREHYCDGLGDCLPACPTGAITFETREAPAYDAAAVAKAGLAKGASGGAHCPGTRLVSMTPGEEKAAAREACPSQLRQWPVQLKLVPENAPWLDGAELLVAADCTAFAYGAFHQRFIRNHVTLIGCPKLDGEDYSGKLARILLGNNIRSLTVVRMEVPCCGGLERAVKKALQSSGRNIPCKCVVISVDGRILDET